MGLIYSCNKLVMVPSTRELVPVASFFGIGKYGKHFPDLLNDKNFNPFSHLVQKNMEGLFYPYCSESKSPCIVMESPVNSLRIHGAITQPLATTYMFSDMMRKCRRRDIEGLLNDGMITIERFMQKNCFEKIGEMDLLTY